MTYRAIFMGSDPFSLPVFRHLVDAGPHLPVPVETAAVVTQPDRPIGRGRRVRGNPVKVLACELQIPFLQPARLRDPEPLEELAALQPDVIVVAAYGQILPESLLGLPSRGCLNLHPSLLPRYRGPTPVVSTIIAGDEITGTTLMLMAAAIDTGPIISQMQTPVLPDESAGELESRLAELSGSLLIRDLPAWMEGRLEPHAQDERQATYTTKLAKEDGRILWSLRADMIARFVRALNPWPTVYGYWNGRQIQLLRARAITGDAPPGQVLGLQQGGLAVGAGAGILLIDELRLAGGRALPAREVIRGHPDLLGARLV
jgi:methionyl-tRNA formyltransferase